MLQTNLPSDVEVLLPTLGSLPLAAMITDRGGLVRWANASLTTLLGYSLDELIGQHVGGIAAPLSLDPMLRVISSSEPWRGQSFGVRKNGEVCAVEQSISPITDASGAATHALWTLQPRSTIQSAATGMAAMSDEAIILDCVQQPFLRLDSEFRFTFVNKMAASMMGMSAADLLGKMPWEVHPEAAGTALEQGYREVKAQNTTLTFENYYEPWQRLYRVTVMPDSQAGFVTHFADITDSKRTETALLLSEEQHRIILQTAMDGFAVTDMEGRVLEVNDAYCRMTGYTAEEMVTLRITDLDVNESSSDTADHIRRIVTHGSDRFESRQRRKDGTVFDIEVSVQYRDTNGGRFVCFQRDITERKGAEQELRRSEEFFRTIWTQAAVGVALVDFQTGRFRQVNRKYSELLGFSAERLSQLDFRTITHPDDLQADLENARRLNSGEIREFTMEKRYLRPDGSERWVRIWVSKLLQGGSVPADHIAIVEDITESKLAEQERAKLTGQLLQAQKMESVGRLAGGVAHDFNNLLTIINGYGELLVEGLRASDPLRHYAEEIGKAGERAARLTTQLLAFSRKQIIEPRLIDLNMTLLESVPMLQRLIGEDVALNTRLDPSLDLVLVDPNQIHQVVMNILVNARDAMSQGGTVEIRTANVVLDEQGAVAIDQEATAGPYVAMSITDTGCGMDEATRRQIFEPFFTTKASGKGTGLGLSMVFGIVRQSSGWIEVSSEPGLGSTFKLYFPAKPDALPSPGKGLPSDLRIGTETILLVEDQNAVRSFGKAVLEKFGYRVLEASCAEDALALAEGHTGPIDVLIADVVLPGINGKVLSDKLGALLPNLKVIFISGYAEDVIGNHGVLDPATSFVAKPFRPDTLAAKVRQVLDAPLK